MNVRSLTIYVEPNSRGADPQWANPIKNRIRNNNQARAINEVVNAIRPPVDDSFGCLHVVNGISTNDSSTLTTAARENVYLGSFNVEGLPGRPGNSTIRWGGGLRSHLEVQETDEDATLHDTDGFKPPLRQRTITPSLTTLEKAVAARIYFENLYFPLFRHPPSREQRRLAMEKDMVEMQLSQAQKASLRARWRQNETEYLRERRQKVDVSAFTKLKTIGHGLDLFPAYISLTSLTQTNVLQVPLEWFPSSERNLPAAYML